MVRYTRKKRSNRNSQRSLRSQKRSDDDAGKAIAAGGFGCVFMPAIACADASIANKMKTSGYEYITKVMLKKHATEEMNEVNRIVPIVSKIPNSKRYFLLDGIFQCSNFGPLSSEDVKNFDSKCGNLTRHGITSSNVNQNLNRMSAIYIPYGGISVAEIMRDLARVYNKTTKSPAKKLGTLIWSLADVIQNGIVPMNKLGLIHLDLKGDNLLVNESVLNSGKMPYMKVIDWGLAGVIHGDSIADAAQDRPLQFNGPFSNILFNKSLVDGVLLGSCYKGEISEAQIMPIATHIVTRMVSDWAGHANYIATDLRQFTQPFIKATGRQTELNSTASCTTEALTIVAEYIAPVLRKYLSRQTNGMLGCRFDQKAYFNDVYRWNCDIWGALVSLQEFIGRVGSYTSHREDSILKGISNILFKYCFAPTYAAERIPLNDVLKDLHKLAGMCGVASRPPPEAQVPVAPAPKAATIAIPVATKKKLVLRQDSPTTIDMKPGRSKCPKGYTKHSSKPNKCKKKTEKKKGVSPKRAATKKARASPKPIHSLPLGRKRCPPGFKKLSGDGLYTKIVCVKNKK